MHSSERRREGGFLCLCYLLLLMVRLIPHSASFHTHVCVFVNIWGPPTEKNGAYCRDATQIKKPGFFQFFFPNEILHFSSPAWNF